MSQDIYDELARYDEAFEPSNLDIKAGLDTLADGEYQLQITGAEVARTPNTKEAIFRMQLLVLSGPSGVGSTVERVNFFGTQQSINILGGDLVALGFDAELWRPPARPFSREFAKVMPLLPGIRFQGRKSTKKESDEPGAKRYHNLYIRARLGAPLGPPPSRSTTPRQPQQSAASPTPSQTRDEVPFSFLPFLPVFLSLAGACGVLIA